MPDTCRILVTGAGSGVGQAIIKALRLSNLPLKIIVADISPMNAGLYVGDEGVIIPRVESDGALDSLILAIVENCIDVVMIGSEFELEFFARHKNDIEIRTGALVFVSPLETVIMADNKYLTAEFLRENKKPYAQAIMPVDGEAAISQAKEWGYPICVKSCTGTSSRNVNIVHQESQLIECFNATPDAMLQKVFAEPSSDLGAEYTCSIFKAADGEIFGPFMARRTVRGGTSWVMEVGNYPELIDPLIDIASCIDFFGSLNIQLMLGEDGPVPFEINARFSGTTAVRAHFGFNEPDMALRNFFFKQDIDKPSIRTGVVFRYHEEVFLEGVNADGLQAGHHFGAVNSWF